MSVFIAGPLIGMIPQKKSKDTLRLSAIALVSTLPVLNVLTILTIVGIVNEHTPINKFMALGMVCILMVCNFFYFNSRKSDLLRDEYLQKDESKKRNINFYFFLYLIASMVVLIGSILCVVYYKINTEIMIYKSHFFDRLFKT